MPVAQTISELMHQLFPNCPHSAHIQPLLVGGRRAGSRYPQAIEDAAGRVRLQLRAAEKLAVTVVTDQRFYGEPAIGLGGRVSGSMVFNSVAVEFPGVG